jgi:hypothetical protein
MTSFLDGGVSALFSGMFSGFYLDATLFRKPTFTDDGAGGGTDNPSGTGEAVKVQPDQTTQAMRETEGYVDTDKRFLMLAHGVAEPDTDAELQAEGKRWGFVNWNRDPCSAYFDCHCRYRSG